VKKIFSFITAASLLVMSSCADKSVVKPQHEQVQISFSWWGNDSRHEYTIAGIELFEKLHPDIKVDVSYSEWSGYESRSRVRMISDTESDVMQINIGWIKQFSPDGKGYYDISQVTDYVDLSEFSDDILEYGKVDGILNAVPVAMNAQTIYINKTIYEQYGLDIPKTWDDFFDAAKVMSKDGIYPISAASKSMWLFTMSYAEQKVGKCFVSDDGKLSFSADELKTMMKMYCDIVNSKVAPLVEYYERINIENGVYGGTIAWVSDAENYCGAAMKKGYEIIPAPYTVIDGQQSGSGWHAKPATLYAISKNTEHPKEAAILLDFMLNSEEMALLQGVEKGIPLSTSARQSLDDAGQLQGLQYDASLLMENNSELTQMDPIVENTSLINAFFEACNLVIYDKTDIDTASQELYKTLNDITADQH